MITERYFEKIEIIERSVGLNSHKIEYQKSMLTVMENFLIVSYSQHVEGEKDKVERVYKIHPLDKVIGFKTVLK